MNVLICGGRDFATIYNQAEIVWMQSKLYGVLFDLARKQYPNWGVSAFLTWPANNIIVGGATGIDTAAAYYCHDWATKERGVNIKVFPALWKLHGKAAGFIRNKQMLDEGKPDVVIAFPGGKGTDMMVELAKERGVEIIDYRYSFPDAA